jgi:hypothetical protein
MAIPNLDEYGKTKKTLELYGNMFQDLNLRQVHDDDDDGADDNVLCMLRICVLRCSFH